MLQQNDHGFAVGDVVTIALTGDYDGTFTVLRMMVSLKYIYSTT